MAAAAYKADSRILGVILAGGQSRRMGGGDKSLTDLGGQPLLAHVIARFAPQVATLILNANGDPLTLALPLAEFAKAYDGPPTDPKVFEETQKKLQEELQKRAAEARQKLENAAPPANPAAK